MSVQVSSPLPQLLASERRLQPAELLALRCDNSGPIAVITVGGDLDIFTSHLLTELADGVLSDRRPLIMVLDLAALRFFGAEGISALLHVRATATAIGTHLVLRNPSPMTRTVLAITAMLDTFDITAGAGWPRAGSGRGHPYRATGA